MKLQLITIDRGSDPHWQALADEFTKRVQPWCPLTVTTLKPLVDKEKEGQALLAAVPNGAYVVMLDEQGQQFPTNKLAQKLEGWQQQGTGTVALLIGGADGHSAAVKAAAQEIWALSQLTLPHRMAKVIMLEQLYRALSILHNHPYHRG